jgi:hypothetical protein
MTARRSSLRGVLLLTVVAACDAPQATEPTPQFSNSVNSLDELASEVRVLAAGRGVVPLPPARRVRQPLVVLGQMLAFDKILSGNRNISCMSCHVARFSTDYSESHLKLQHFDPSPLEILLRGTVLPNTNGILATRDVILEGVVLPDDVVTQLMAYMSALTDDAARNLKHIAPARVPSGLPVDR